MDSKDVINGVTITIVGFVLIALFGFVLGSDENAHVNQHANITIVSKDSRIDGEGVTHYYITYKDESGKVIPYFKDWNNPYYVYENVEAGKTYDVEYGSEAWVRTDDINGSRYFDKINGKDVSDHAANW
jgi:hypothetical protein